MQLAEHHAGVMKRVEILRIDFDDRLQLLGRFLKFSSYEKRAGKIQPRWNKIIIQANRVVELFDGGSGISLLIQQQTEIAPHGGVIGILRQRMFESGGCIIRPVGFEICRRKVTRGASIGALNLHGAVVGIDRLLEIAVRLCDSAAHEKRVNIRRCVEVDVLRLFFGLFEISIFQIPACQLCAGDV